MRFNPGAEFRPSSGWSSGWGRGGWIGIVLLLMVSGGCATSPPPSSKPILDSHDDKPVSTALRTEIQSWLGTPHRLGGLSRRGVDCSGLVVVVYDTLFDLHLPRTTADLIHSGQRVDQTQLVSGDLVFFNPGYKSRHVGIYLGRGEFAHASTSRGVIISRLNDVFWQKCYITGRRIL